MALTQDQRALVEAILKTLREEPALLEELRRLLVPEIVVFLPDLKLIAERQAALEERLTRELNAVWDVINALRQEVAGLRTEVRGVVERQERLEQRQERLEQRQEQLEQRMGRLEQRMDGLEQRMGGLDQRMDRMEQRQDRTERRLQRVETDISQLKSRVQETTYRTNFLDFFGFWVLSAEDAPRRLWERIDDALKQNLISPDEFDELRRADLRWLGVLRRGKFVGQEVLIVAEFSWTVHSEDVERALRRAEIARKVGFWAAPLVASEDWESEKLKAEALAKGVICVDNGKVEPLDWDEVLIKWRN